MTSSGLKGLSVTLSPKSRKIVPASCGLRLKAECTALMYHLTAEINSVFADDDEKRRIAKLHYVDGVTLNAIASKHMHYSYGCVKNKNAEIAAYLNL